MCAGVARDEMKGLLRDRQVLYCRATAQLILFQLKYPKIKGERGHSDTACPVITRKMTTQDATHTTARKNWNCTNKRSQDPAK